MPNCVLGGCSFPPCSHFSKPQHAFRASTRTIPLAKRGFSILHSHAYPLHPPPTHVHTLSPSTHVRLNSEARPSMRIPQRTPTSWLRYAIPSRLKYPRHAGARTTSQCRPGRIPRYHRLSGFSLRNYPLHLDQVGELGLDA
ncbi:hypothetical protein BDU57DRAFT_291389 [Ampelomyces quisqualis]|uniref:Uncharacterized protein n=1 Tax=Ampelomyces quisqualis TaxID=50730 RepID=A0A6A5QG44_AMPQU|nr:hypothetical protein BDU57DRAFT_291389 [Ampelomyces quisqualis]